MKKILVILVMLVAMNANAQWVQMSNGIPAGNVFSLTSIENNIFAGTYGYGVYKSTNNGQNWSYSGLQYDIYTLLRVDSIIFAGVWESGVYFSSNAGQSWIQTSLNFRGPIQLKNIGNNIFAIYGIYPQTSDTTDGIYISTNNGMNWNKTSFEYLEPTSIEGLGNNIYAGTRLGGIYKSTDNGANWGPLVLNVPVLSIGVKGNSIFVGTNGFGVYVSTNNGINWTQTSMNNKHVTSIITYGNDIIIGTDSGVYISTNDGLNWSSINQGFNSYKYIKSLFIANNYIFAGSFVYNVWRRPLSEIIGIQNISTETPSKYSLSQNYPNPFNSTSNLKFQIVNTEDVKLIVYDIMGKEVQTLVNERLQPGTYEAAFDASSLNTGVYFYKLITNGFSETKKMLLIK